MRRAWRRRVVLRAVRASRRVCRLALGGAFGTCVATGSADEQICPATGLALLPLIGVDALQQIAPAARRDDAADRSSRYLVYAYPDA